MPPGILHSSGVIYCLGFVRTGLKAFAQWLLVFSPPDVPSQTSLRGF